MNHHSRCRKRRRRCSRLQDAVSEGNEQKQEELTRVAAPHAGGSSIVMTQQRPHAAPAVDFRVRRGQCIYPECHLKVALDFSMRTPGIGFFDGYEIYIYFVGYRKREKGMAFTLTSTINPSLTVRIMALPEPDRGAKNLTRAQSYENLVSMCDDLIAHHQKLSRATAEQTHVAIEHYAFGANGSSMSKLYEIGGIMRNRLLVSRGITKVSEVPPSKLKKSFTEGMGRASKGDMFRHFTGRWGFPDPSSALRFKSPVLQIATEGPMREKTPKPIEDIVDAFALLTIMDERLHTPMSYPRARDQSSDQHTHASPKQ